MASHEIVVGRIAAAVRALYNRKESYRIFHGSTNSTRPVYNGRMVDISALSNIVKIDPASRIAIVEPNVPMDRLVKATLNHGLVPPVVMEFPGITVGGGYAGSAGESSSFKYGYFDQTVNSIEAILANGDVITASMTEHTDFFKGAAGALGTLGITTLIELQLIPAKKFVKTLYHRTNNIHDTVHTIQREKENPAIDYIDGIIFSETHGVVITGQLVDSKPDLAKSQTFSKAWDPWYYLHVQNRTTHDSLSSPPVDYVPLSDYLFRYDRGGFWVGLEAFRYVGLVAFNRLTRWIMDDFMHTRMLYRALQKSNRSFDYIIQDLSLPYSTAEEFIKYTSKELGIWPLWLCPLREMNPPTFHPYTTQPGPGDSPKPMLNIGLWGPASKDLDIFTLQNRRLESKLTELGGRKVLYSHAYYTEPEFWQLYNRKWYDDLRQRYSATGLLTVYDKVKVDVAKYKQQRGSWYQRLSSLWPFAGIFAMVGAIRSKDYLLHRKSLWRTLVAAVSSEKEATKVQVDSNR